MLFSQGTVSEQSSDPATGTQANVISYTEELRIPPLAVNTSNEEGIAKFSLIAGEGETEFYPGVFTETIGYNGALLGPTLKVFKGERVEITVENTLSEATTLHWHGMHLPAEFDGGPYQVLEAGGSWFPQFTIDQQAATLWYHPHLMGKTAEQVYQGLAGLVIIEDEISQALPIPKEYGVDDIPLVFQDRRFFRDGTFDYKPLMPDVMMGYFGNTMLVNGSVSPTFPVVKSITRFRVLNGSNSTVMRYSLSDGKVFHQIASDGGFLTAPIPMWQIILSPGERAELLIDFSDGESGSMVVETNGGATYTGVIFDTEQMEPVPNEIPAALVDIPEPDTSAVTGVRQFVMSTGMGGNFTINGNKMDISRVDEHVPVNEYEIWEVVNAGMGMMNIPHSFHIHDGQFRALDVNGRDPDDTMKGWKDTFLLWPGDTIRILVRFEEYTGKYMYHCHLLEHEDSGMMGVFEVVE